MGDHCLRGGKGMDKHWTKKLGQAQDVPLCLLIYYYAIRACLVLYLVLKGGSSRRLGDWESVGGS